LCLEIHRQMHAVQKGYANEPIYGECEEWQELDVKAGGGELPGWQCQELSSCSLKAATGVFVTVQ